jgi:alanine racemase
MGRIGFPTSEIDSWLPLVSQLNALTVDGVFSHFSDAESVNEKYTQRQLAQFHQVLSRLESTKIFPAASHMAKSAALVTIPASHLTMVRPGLILYGMYPAPQMQKQIALKPVLSWRTRIIQLKCTLPPERTSVTAAPSLLREIAS